MVYSMVVLTVSTVVAIVPLRSREVDILVEPTFVGSLVD